MTESSPEAFSILRLMLAIGTVAILMGLFAWVLQRFSPHPFLFKQKGGAARRMKIIESFSLDTRRRLVLVRLDDKEHLLLLGQQQDIVVATSPAPLPSSDEPAPHDQK